MIELPQFSGQTIEKIEKDCNRAIIRLTNGTIIEFSLGGGYDPMLEIDIYPSGSFRDG